MLKTGDRAPSFRGPDQHGRDVSLDELVKNGPVVLYFYPKDFTRVCTDQACMFRDVRSELAGQGVQVVGVSVDDEGSHGRFAAQHGVDFPLLSDKNREIARAYGALQPFGVFAKRVTFVIDQGGIIRGVFHHELSAKRHLEGVRTILHHLQAA
jgi:peroxiredoxin Q/BCP